MPQTPRERMAVGVFEDVSRRIASASPGSFAFDHSASRFGSIISRTKTGAAGCEDEIDIAAFGNHLKGFLQVFEVVSDYYFLNDDCSEGSQ